jgi:hypothetical protein
MVEISTNELRLNRNEKNKAANVIGVKPASINNYLVKFCKIDLMQNLTGGTYLLNPNVANRSPHGNVGKLRQKYKRSEF